MAVEEPVTEEQEDEIIETPRNLAEWVEVLGEKGMPAFAKTVKEISSVASNRESSASELSRVVLQDAAMTSRLLRVANSPMYNMYARGISTVSRAVVLLGFDSVRSLCLSIKVVESVSNGVQKERLAADMARSFHAAVQAQSFAEQRRDDSPEEVFIATLLMNIGQLAFWSHGSQGARELHESLGPSTANIEQAMQKKFGFTMHELSVGLTKQWQIGGLLQKALEGSATDDPRITNVTMAHELAALAEHGWDTPEMNQLLKRIAEMLYLPLKDVSALVEDNANQAAKTASFFGADKAVELIPLPGGKASGPGRAVKSADQKVPKFPEPDMNLQLKILRELSGMVESKFDINLMLEMVLEGMYRGVGMDRALFALLNADRSILKARYALGWNHHELRDRFGFQISPLNANIFFHILDQREAVWVGDRMDMRLKTLVTDDVKTVSENADFFAMPIEINGRAIGLFYADREPSGRPMDEDSFASFKHFGNQANMALAFSRR